MRRYYSNGANGLTKAQKTLPPELKEKTISYDVSYER